MGGAGGWRRIASSKVAYTNFYDEIGAIGNDTSSKVVAQIAFTDPYSRVAVKGGAKQMRRSVLAQGHSSWLPSSRNGPTNRQGEVWRGVVTHRRKTRHRASEHAPKRSRLQK